MNRRIEDDLEAFLSGKLSTSRLAEFQRDLAESGAETQRLIAGMARQSRLIQSALRPLAEDDAEPMAGFYARVMDRIEAQRAASPFWSAFLEPLFFKRLVMASATLMLLLGITLFSGSIDDTAIAADAQSIPHVIMAGEPEPLTVTTVSDGSAEGRDVVLGDLTTYQE